MKVRTEFFFLFLFVVRDSFYTRRNMNNSKLERLRKLVGKKVLIFTIDKLRFEGKVISADNDFLELYDDVRVYRKFIKINLIADIQVNEVLEDE